MTSPPERIFRSPRWLSVFLGVTAAALLLVSVSLLVVRGVSWSSGILLGLALLCLLGLADALTTRVVLHGDRMEIRSNFRRRVLPRAELARVTWGAGVGVSVELTSGGFLQLPDVGNAQSVSNSIRAWLARTGARS